MRSSVISKFSSPFLFPLSVVYYRIWASALPKSFFFFLYCYATQSKVKVQFSSAVTILEALNRAPRFTACKVNMCTKVLNVFRTESPVTLKVGSFGKSLAFGTYRIHLFRKSKRKKFIFLYHLHSVIVLNARSQTSRYKNITMICSSAL